MIRNESEYRESCRRLTDLRDQVSRIKAELRDKRLSKKAIALAVMPQEALVDDLAWEISLFEKLRLGKVQAIPRFPVEQRGKALICLRIVKGWNQRRLAAALGVPEAQISRDERNEYRGLSLDRYARILDVLGYRDEGAIVPKVALRKSR